MDSLDWTHEPHPPRFQVQGHMSHILSIGGDALIVRIHACKLHLILCTRRYICIIRISLV